MKSIEDNFAKEKEIFANQRTPEEMKKQK